MIVRELIAALQRQDPEATVVFLNNSIEYENVSSVFEPLSFERPLVEQSLPDTVGVPVVALG